MALDFFQYSSDQTVHQTDLFWLCHSSFLHGKNKAFAKTPGTQKKIGFTCIFDNLDHMGAITIKIILGDYFFKITDAIWKFH